MTNMKTSQFSAKEEILENLFISKQEDVKSYTKTVEDVCAKALENIRHSPITSRIKSWESARGTLGRRYNERLAHTALCNAVKGQHRDSAKAQRAWEDFSRHTNLTKYNEGMVPFETPKEILDALHDFGGVRIALYFPGDVQKVTETLKDHLYVTSQRNKGDEPQISIKDVSERYFSSSNSGTRGAEKPIRTFAGYKATHLVVKLRDEQIQQAVKGSEAKKKAWEDIVVEIQVGTLVMHVWSEIEHDMIYKQLNIEGGKVSEDEERILDLFNGIVLTGEASLRQLEASTLTRLEKRAEKKDLLAGNHYELAAWLEKDCQELGLQVFGRDWTNANLLFRVLELAGSHNNAHVTGLIASIKRNASHRQFRREELPIEMLSVFSNQPTTMAWPSSNGNKPAATLRVKKARLWAIRLVQSVNLAVYLGVGFEFIYCSVRLARQLDRPSLSSLLNLLHPHQPCYSSLKSVDAIARYCQAIVEDPMTWNDPENRKTQWLLEVARKLPVNKMIGVRDSFCSSNYLTICHEIFLLFPNDGGDSIKTIILETDHFRLSANQWGAWLRDLYYWKYNFKRTLYPEGREKYPARTISVGSVWIIQGAMLELRSINRDKLEELPTLLEGTRKIDFKEDFS